MQKVSYITKRWIDSVESNNPDKQTKHFEIKDKERWKKLCQI